MNAPQAKESGRRNWKCRCLRLIPLPQLFCLLGLLPGLQAAAAERLDFATRILPILTKAGCNGGGCHGAAVGAGGLKLSLLGYDPASDHAHLTREIGGRRIDVASPTNSLFFRKGTGQLDHEGGRRIRSDSAELRTLLEWIAAAAPFGPADLRVARIEVEPANALLAATGASTQLRVTATLSDGRTEDVTPLALYSSNDDAIADVSKTGLVTTRARGVTSIMVRYSGQAVAARIAVPFSDGKFDAPGFTPRNFIDEQLLAELRRLRLPPSGPCGDAEFLRRVTLDLTGRLPAPEVVTQFLAEPPSDAKRDRVIAALVASPEFTDYWTMLFGDWLLIRGARGSEGAARVYHDWVRAQVAANRPLDAFVRDLLLAEGEITRDGPPNYFTLASDPRDLGEHVGSMFLGAQIACARCHAHPADRWTQDDYHAFAAYFARVAKQGEFIRVSTRGEVEHPRTGRPVAPKPLGAAPLDSHDDEDRRAALATWLTAPDNPFFARNVANRVWRHLLGRGLVEPVDDLRPTNPASIPALLDALGGQLAANRFDLRWLVTEITRSRAYQLDSRTNDANRRDDRLFSHAFLKPLPAQVFVDVVAQATGVADAFENAAPGTRAVQLAGAVTPSFALDVLGRCSRERSCETLSQSGGGLAQALHLINGSTINDKLRGGALASLLASDTAPGEIVNALYLRTLSRLPRADELAAWMPSLEADRARAAEDLLWALLNSREFAFNH